MSDAKRIVSEETWQADGQMLFRAEGDGEMGVASFGMVQGDSVVPNQDERARIAACAPEALRMLLDVETSRWLDFHGDSGRGCPWCEAVEIEDHTPHCAWLALMRKAGLR